MSATGTFHCSLCWFSSSSTSARTSVTDAPETLRTCRIRSVPSWTHQHLVLSVPRVRNSNRLEPTLPDSFCGQWKVVVDVVFHHLAQPLRQVENVQVHHSLRVWLGLATQGDYLGWSVPDASVLVNLFFFFCSTKPSNASSRRTCVQLRLEEVGCGSAKK